jgi:SAM-dependent methyltransferase
VKTEFYDTAVQLGYYGIERSGLIGKKDNVRKYWEDISIKLSLRPVIETLLEKKKKIRVMDLGCGSGEGFELLTHIPMKDHINSVDRDFILNHDDIEKYVGLDISGSMIEQGNANYSKYNNITFEKFDLSKGLPKAFDEPYDLYFSSYASLSHLSYGELLNLTHQLVTHIDGYGIIVYDLLGKYSPEWPVYWMSPANSKLPYNMAYLYSEKERKLNTYEKFNCTFWSPEELHNIITSAARKSHKTIISTMRDRSIFVGRHMDTGIFNNNKTQYRYQVNRLFDRDFRGKLNELTIDLDYTRNFMQSLPERVVHKLNHYMKQWNYVIAFIESLSDSNKVLMHNILINIDEPLSDDLEMMSWLFRNASRFPVTDFWASIMGPQIACVLRNCEMNYLNAVGCGHGLFCITEIS